MTNFHMKATPFNSELTSSVLFEIEMDIFVAPNNGFCLVLDKPPPSNTNSSSDFFIKRLEKLAYRCRKPQQPIFYRSV